MVRRRNWGYLKMQPKLHLALGTHVVLLRKIDHQAKHSVAQVVATPCEHSEYYTVRCVDGTLLQLSRQDFGLRKQFNDPLLSLEQPQLAENRQWIQYRCVVGSRAYGLDTPESDTDWRGFFVPPATVHWGLATVPEQYELVETQEHYWEVQKFLNLLLRANPNALECLYTDLVEHSSPLALELRAMRHKLLTSRIYQSHNSYVLAQFRLLERDLRTHGSLRWKHVMHLIRLLLSGIHALRHGELRLRHVAEHDQLMAIRAGELEWDAINRWRIALHAEFEQAYAATKLPILPDLAAANAWLLQVRRAQVD